MAAERPRVSIGMPVFNGEHYIEAALESILGQTYTDLELIISDNASTDRTPLICQAYAARDHRVRYYRNEHNLGAAANFNRTFELSHGDYFKWAAHDDVLAPEFVSRCIAVLDQDPEVVLAHPKTQFIDECGRALGEYKVRLRTDSPLPRVRFHDLIWVRHWCMQVFGLVRSTALRRTALHGDYASADRVLLVQLAFLGRFCEIPECLFFSRVHGQQASRMVHDLYAYAAWFKPVQQGQLVFPASKLALEHWRAVRDAPLSPADRAYCYASGLLRLLKYSSILARDLFVPVRLVARRLAPDVMRRPG